MKTVLIIFIAFISFSLSQAQTSSSCDIPPELFENYKEDVKEIALQRIYNQNSPYVDSITIPQVYQDSIWDGLAAIFNAYSIIERDSVFDIHCIHWDVPWRFTRAMYIGITEDCSWYENWQNLNMNTGVPELDNILSTYGFTLISFSPYIHAAFFTTEQDLNVPPICNSIEGFSGVDYSEPFFDYGDGNRIIYQINDDGASYSFKIGYQGCPMGCQSHYTYHFQVYNDCSVDYLGFDNWQEDPYPPLPDPSYCYITSTKEINSQGEYSIYPNPTSSVLNIEHPFYSSQSFLVEIYNLTGSKIKSAQSKNRKLSIDISDLRKGIYFVRISSYGKNSKTLKFVKE